MPVCLSVNLPTACLRICLFVFMLMCCLTFMSVVLCCGIACFSDISLRDSIHFKTLSSVLTLTLNLRAVAIKLLEP